MPVMRKLSALFCLVLLGMLHGNAQFLSVFPGDANANGGCSHADLLQIGQSYQFTGPPRNAQDIIWSAHPAQSWVGNPGSINAAHADCNGDGLVDRFDALAIEANFGQPFGTMFTDNNSIGSGNSPQLGINLVQDSIFVQGTTVLTLSIELGTQTNPVDSIYGLAMTITYDPQIVDNVTLAWTGGFLADTVGNSILFARADTILGKIYLAVTGTDHINRMGYGTLGTIGIVMDDNIRVTGRWDLMLEPTYVLGMTTSSALVEMNPRSDTLTVITGRKSAFVNTIDIFPNPATAEFGIRSDIPMEAIVLLDSRGRVVLQQQNIFLQSEIIRTDHLAAGCYFLEVHTSNGISRKKLIVQTK
jgi:hypothetical protein